ncbi:MAG TPA: MFS transporter [Acidimicrobiia bacterium]
MKTRATEVFRTTFRSLRNRNFRLFFAGQLVSQSGVWLTSIALTLLVLHRTHSGVAIGLLVACQFGPILLFGIWGGLVADRSDKRKLLVITQILEMLQSFALAALAFMGDAPLLAFYATALAGGFMLVFDSPTRRSFVAEMVCEPDVQNAVMLNTALMTGSRVIGPAVAGALVVTAGFGWCFFADGVSYLAVIASLLLMRRAELRQPSAVKRGKRQLRAALQYTRNAPDLWIPLVMMTMVGTLTFNFAVVLPLFVEHTLHGSDDSFTLLYSVLSVGSVIGALAAAHMRVINTRHVVYASFAFGATMFGLAASPTLGAAFPVAVFVGLTSVAFITASTAIVQVRADPKMRGRVLALQGMMLIGTTPIGGPLLGFICDQWGARAGIALGAATAVGAGFWGLAAHRRAARAESPEVSGTHDVQLLAS